MKEGRCIDIIIPVYNESANIYSALKLIKEKVEVPYNLFLIYDFEKDNTLPVAHSASQELAMEIDFIKNNQGTKIGVLNAIKTGLKASISPYAVVTMADLSDPPEVINSMYKKAIENNYDLVCGSRYMKGGKQIGGPLLKRNLSRLAGVSLRYLIRFPTHDVTNSFKLYGQKLLKSIELESKGGFEVGMEIAVKAYVAGFSISEVPTAWWDRTNGASRFLLFRWLPRYLKWYLWAILKTVKKINRTSQ
ncbi:MAG: glycosyltransferase family 2 protein [Oligoflexia bacterium]|nr:glycosyltransferase family 2 protein [Oligoflexia bacterium]